MRSYTDLLKRVNSLSEALNTARSNWLQGFSSHAARFNKTDSHIKDINLRLRLWVENIEEDRKKIEHFTTVITDGTDKGDICARMESIEHHLGLDRDEGVEPELDILKAEHKYLRYRMQQEIENLRNIPAPAEQADSVGKLTTEVQGLQSQVNETVEELKRLRVFKKNVAESLGFDTQYSLTNEEIVKALKQVING